MSTSKFEPSIISRPVYGKLSAQTASHNLLIADAQGAEAIIEMAEHAPKSFFEQAHIIYIQKGTADAYLSQLESLGANQLYIGPTYQAALPRILNTLENTQVGIKLYLAGTEGLIGQVIRDATRFGVAMSDIQTEHRGSTARRIQCVHCKGIIEDVTVDPFQCSHCGLFLFVRDHYSRRIAAFQGVRVDAEDPGNIPEAVERFK
jgi:predicted RNA-binding Zn-ribbon protein involved in translation (DUF1610 family)